MKDLIAMNEFGFMADKEGIARVDSRFVADAFDKQHRHVLRDIEKLTESKSGLSADFIRLNFEPSRYTDVTGRRQPCYRLTRDGFTILAMGYTGEKAMRFKEAYIRRFNEMEQHIATILNLRAVHSLLNNALKAMSEDPKPYVYSNEMNMINRIVLGMSAKQYRKKHELPEKASPRSYMTAEEAALMDHLQTIDVGLVVAGIGFSERKQKLEWAADRWREQQAAIEAAINNALTA